MTASSSTHKRDVTISLAVRTDLSAAELADYVEAARGAFIRQLLQPVGGAPSRIALVEGDTSAGA